MRFRLICVPLVFATLVSTVSAQSVDLTGLLFAAVAIDDAAMVSTLIGRGADFQAVGLNGLTPLALASSLDEAYVAMILVDAGALPALPDRATSPLTIAVVTGSSHVVSPLLSKGVTPTAYNDALTMAATRGDPVTLREMLKASPLPEMDMDRLTKTLKARYGIAVSADGLGPDAVLATLKLCRDAGIYSAFRCVSHDVVAGLPPVREDVPPQDCDRLTAHYLDPDVPPSVQPVLFDRIDVSKAIPACTEAVGRFPNERRFMTELGRAKEAARSPDSIEWFRKADAAGSAMATYMWAAAILNPSTPKDGAVSGPDYRTIGTLMAKAASEGNAAAMQGLATLYGNGQGVAKDGLKAIKLLDAAARKGSREAMNDLGAAYLDGTYGEKNLATALEWYRKSSDAGSREGMLILGLMYAMGKGVPKDIDEATRLWKAAVVLGDADAAAELGVRYQDPRSGTPDDQTSRAWYETSASMGSAEGARRLGAIYDKGTGVPKDVVMAAKWYAKAADLGSAEGMRDLGYYSLQGTLGKIDCVKARSWFRKSADLGNRDAMENLGFTYASKVCNDVNMPEGVKWLKKAAALGDPTSKTQLDQLRKKGVKF